MDFIESIKDHTQLVFADEKSMKEIIIFCSVRENVRTGTTPNHTMNANSKNRYSILAAVTLKGNSVRPVEFLILKQCVYDALFVQFIRILLDKGTLSRGDICIVDNYSIYLNGGNIGLKGELFKNDEILMITLTPYHPDFNPTELVFNTLLQRLTSL